MKGAVDSSCQVGFPSCADRRAIAAVDLDGDRDLDVAVAGAAGVELLLNGGDGRLSAGGAVPVGSNPSNMTSGDLDVDGDIDLATVNDQGNVSVLLNSSDGTFADVRHYAVGKPAGLHRRR